MSQTDERVAVFAPEVFEVANLEQAMAITVTQEDGTTTAERWETETRYLVADIAQRLSAGPQTCVLDYGCGVGRIAKGLIEQTGCRVIGVDASRSMRELAPGYVLSDRFQVWSPEVLQAMLEKGFRFDCAMSLWVIQHVLDARQVIRLVESALPPGALFYALNQGTRCVPSNKGWVNDGFDVWSALATTFTELVRYPLPLAVTTPGLAQQSIIQVLSRRTT